MDRFSTGLAVEELGPRIRRERLARQLSLEQLAVRSGVSRSMLSDIERGGKLPSVVVLDSTATALGVTISQLLGEPTANAVTVLRRETQHGATNPAGWQWRTLSPRLAGDGPDFLRGTAPPATSGPEFAAHATGSREWVAVEHGSLSVVVDGEEYRLEEGDAICYAADRSHRFANIGDRTCTYYLVLDIKPWPSDTSHEGVNPAD
ncbi:XRE family transcriptional regulator [Tamaricihabitans halophyticus]|uniref:XRE family transcriptional regulator n=1 Tax=Tamaricihabitans halophyticus TaxID=1262583 RepID=A0A4R2Q271_9PSEU|nr:XRE family transcriptional regulator [Tamaricihabitans halophyticus]TCP42617.1 XRE family transcriptional regulator [Tamaricihabitans halophyticus]